MFKNNYRGEWAGCSNFSQRVEELRKAHEDFLKVKDLIDDDWKIKSAKRQSNDGEWKVESVKVHKRPRIKISKPKTPREVVVSIFGGKVKMTFAEYKQHGDGMKVLMEIF